MVVPLAIALGIMLSPENLVILGQQSGASGRAPWLWLAAAAGIHLFTARAYAAGGGLATPSPEGGPRPASFRAPLAAALLLASRGGLALWGVTAVLVTAGYVFNETFAPAYPNLGFSFTLLAILVGLNLPGPRLAAIFQVIFVGAALAGLSALMVMGLWGSPPPLPPTGAGGLTWRQGLVLSPNFLLLFIGYDLAGVRGEKGRDQAGSPAAPMLAGIGAAFVLFGLWSYLSLRYVPSLKLQESTVPYAYVAGAIAGDAGRRLMGGVLLAGTLAAANALMMTVPRLVSGLPPAGLLPLIFRSRRLTLLLLGGGLALVMALGLGGSPNLPLFLKASALLWLLTYARQHLIAWRRPGSPEPAGLAVACALALAGAAGLALATDPEWAMLTTYGLLLVGALTLIGSIPYGTGNLKTEKEDSTTR
jgi:amino acid transporter